MKPVPGCAFGLRDHELAAAKSDLQSDVADGDRKQRFQSDGRRRREIDGKARQ